MSVRLRRYLIGQIVGFRTRQWTISEQLCHSYNRLRLTVRKS